MSERCRPHLKIEHPRVDPHQTELYDFERDNPPPRSPDSNDEHERPDDHDDTPETE